VNKQRERECARRKMEGGRVEKNKCIDGAVPLKENTATYL